MDWKPSQVVVVDILTAVVLMLFAIDKLATFDPPTKPSIETLGKYVVEVRWPAARNDDVDTYVEDPAGNILYFAANRIGLMHLEHDDLGKAGDTLELRGRRVSVAENRERAVLRGTIPGEYVANVHMYRKAPSSPATPVTVVLYRLRGADRALKQKRLTLRGRGDEKTAFRFTIDERGDVTGFSDLQRALAGSARRATYAPTTPYRTS